MEEIVLTSCDEEIMLQTIDEDDEEYIKAVELMDQCEQNMNL